MCLFLGQWLLTRYDDVWLFWAANWILQNTGLVHVDSHKDTKAVLFKFCISIFNFIYLKVFLSSYILIILVFLVLLCFLFFNLKNFYFSEHSFQKAPWCFSRVNSLLLPLKSLLPGIFHVAFWRDPSIWWNARSSYSAGHSEASTSIVFCMNFGQVVWPLFFSVKRNRDILFTVWDTGKYMRNSCVPITENTSCERGKE